MKVIEINDKQKWNSFQSFQITQSFEWSIFLSNLEIPNWRFAVINDQNQICAIALCYEVKNWFAKYLYLPNGPVFGGEIYKNKKARNLDKRKIKILSFLLKFLINFSKKNSFDFIKIEPLIENNTENLKEFLKLGLTQSKSAIQANNKWLLDLSKSEEELLKNSKENLAYRIRKAEKKGVKIYISDDFKNFNKFWTLYAETVNRKNFKAFDKKYYEIQCKTLLKEKKYKIAWAQTDSDGILACFLLAFHGDVCYYLHGGTKKIQNSKMNEAPKYLMWSLIKFAKEKGYKYFDFYGISNSAINSYLNNKNHFLETKNDKWSGFSRFKMSFGGFGIKFFKPFDYPTSLKGKIFSTLKNL